MYELSDSDGCAGGGNAAWRLKMILRYKSEGSVSMRCMKERKRQSKIQTMTSDVDGKVILPFSGGGISGKS